MGSDEQPPESGSGDSATPLPSLDEAFRTTLDRHGYGFHYALLKHIQEIRSPWVIEATEVPVSLHGKTTHIDFVLRHSKTLPLRIVAECKRANPALVDWCFVRLPHTPLARSVAFEQVRVYGKEPDTTAYAALRGGWSSDLVYNLGLPIKGHTVGDRTGDNRTALDDAVTQVLRGTNAFMESIAKEPTLLVPSGENAFGIVVPVVFTTAQLWVSDVDLGASELATGKVPQVSLQSQPWLWLKQNISPDLKHTLHHDEPFNRGNPLEDYLLRDYSRCVAIVSAGGTESFLKVGHWTYWTS